MKPVKSALIAILLCAFIPNLLTAQNIQITYTKCDSLFVCNTDTFTIKVLNNLNSALTGAALTVNLPAGLSYIPGSVAGANQQNISNLMSPVFGLPDLPVGQFALVKIILSADCGAADVLDAGQLFIATLSVNSAIGNAQVSTTSIPVETGAVVIQSVTSQLLMGVKGDTLLRTICVKNTRLGKIGALFFEDSHLNGFDVSIANSATQNNALTSYHAEFDGNIFQSVGNGDAWLDLNETVCFTERIIITSCGIPAFNNLSKLRVGWGCGGSICRYDSTTALIEIMPSDKIPNLVFEQIWAPPTDFCGITPAVMGFKIKNTGKADAQSVSLSLTLTEGLTQAGIIGNSFRVVSNNGTTVLPTNSTTPTVLIACGITAVREAFITLPKVAANDSLEFLFDVITCVEPCEQKQPAFRVDYFYQKECPVNGFVSGSELILPPDDYTLKGELHSLNNQCFQPGFSYPFYVNLQSGYLSEDGFLHYKMELPLGFKFDDSCGTSLGGIAPVLNEITTLPDGKTTVHLAWATPLPADTLNFNFCLHVECDTNITCLEYASDSIIYTEICCLQESKNVTYWSPELNTDQNCAISYCETHLLALDNFCFPTGGGGGGDSTDMDPIIPIPGLLNWWNVYRLNLGFTDQDDDRHADNLSTAPANVVRRDRFLAGDTLRVEFCGVMQPGAPPLGAFNRAIWHEIVRNDMSLNDNDTFATIAGRTTFVDTSKVRFLQNAIRIRYADGTEAFCDWGGMKYALNKNYFKIANQNTFPPEPVDEIVSEKFYFAFELNKMFAAGCLPRPNLQEGDSIFVYSDFKLDLNFRPGSTNNPDPPLVGFRTATSFGGPKFAWNVQPHKMLQYSGWKKVLSPNSHSIKPCESSTEPKKFRYSMRIARENMFPFEVRPLASISDYYQTVPYGLTLASAKVDYLVLQDSVPFLSNLTLPFSESPGKLDIDFGPAFADPVDEGFILRTKITFEPNCQFNSPDTSMQYIETQFVGCLNGSEMTTLDSIKNAIGFFSNAPNLQILTNDTTVFSPNQIFDINFILKNLLISSAPAAWMAIVSPSGMASDFELVQTPQNQPISSTNGLYNLGTINGFSQKNYQIRGKNTDCGTDSLLLVFGWGCAPISLLEEANCGRDTLLIKLQLERPELELDILQEPAALTLCDTSEYFEFEVYNAKIGYAYDLKASVKLPTGLIIVPGTCQISYPSGAPWIDITDPSLFPGNLSIWEVSNLVPPITANGLPGVNLDPANSVKIRFKVTAQCGFVSNTPIIYGTTGIEPCGRQSNLLNKPGDPLNIIGLNTSYGVQVGLQATGTPGVACGSEQSFSVSLNLLGTPSPGDSVYVLLPQGLTYISGSYLPGLNAPAGPVTLTAQGFQIPLPILQGGGTMEFKFKVDFGAAAGCADQVLQVQTRVKTEAFCQSLGAPCEVYISTGDAVLILNIPHPQFTISNPGLSIVNGQIYATLTVTNIGTLVSNGTNIQIWRDLDGNGLPSAGDVLIQTLQPTVPIIPGASLQISGLLSGVDSSALCNLLLVIAADLNCSCDDVVYPIEKIQLYHTPLVFCDLNPVLVGVAEQAGFSYQWQPSGLVSCATCANTTFTPNPNTPAGVPQTLILTENSNGCSVTHTFELSFGAIAQILVGNGTICEGNSSTLIAIPPGNSYSWQGPGILNPTLATQTVKPGSSSNYSVIVSFPNGCTASATADITVLNADTVLLSGMFTCAGEPVNIFGNQTAAAGTYKQVLKKLNGCDSTLLQTLTVYPKPQTEEQLVFCQGDSLLVWDSIFTESGTFCRVYSTIHGCDSTHCVNVTEKAPITLTPLDTIYGSYGQIITLSGPNGYITYVWEPTPTPPCVNCPSVTYPADSSGYHEYLLTVGDGDGCTGDLLFRVVVAPPCSPDSLHIPNAFTPNGDGKNDVFRVVPYEGSEVISSLEIYDRWGSKVYENLGNSSWDGTINGQPAPSDVYVYIVKVNCGELIGKRVGDVTLLR